MYNLRSKFLSCPNCHQLIEPNDRTCEHCQVDLALAALMIEQAVVATPPQRRSGAKTAAMLVPRLGDYLVAQGLLTANQLEAALRTQRQVAADGEHKRLGQILICEGFVEEVVLDRCIMEHVLQLRQALEQRNQVLSQRVQEQTAEIQNTLIKLSELNRLKTNFISSVSQELLNPIEHTSHLLHRLIDSGCDTLTARQAEIVGLLKSENDQIRQLIDDLQQFAAAASGDFPLDITKFSADELMQRVLPQAEIKAGYRDITIEVELGQNLPLLKADMEKVVWVIGQLLDNAIKFTGIGGRITISAVTHAGSMTLAVTDTGIGIPAEHREDIFEPFHQLEMAATHHYGGTGLGLALVRRITAAHGSTVDVQSAVGEGSTFAFSLPSPAQTGRLGMDRPG